MPSMAQIEAHGPPNITTLPFLRAATLLLLLFMPFSVFFTVGSSINPSVIPLYAQRGFYLSDLPLALLLVFTLTGDVRWRRGPVLITFSLLGIGLLSFLSIPQAVAPPYAFYSAVRITLALYVYLWFLQPVVPTSIIAMALLFTLAGHATIGVLQVVTQGPLNLPGELALPPSASGAAVTLLDGLRYLRAYGLTFHPNVLGGFLAVTILITVPLLRRWPIIPLWWVLWSGLLLSFSRAAWLAAGLTLPIALVVCFLKVPAARWRLAISSAGLIAILVAFVFLAGGQLSSRLEPVVNLLANRSTSAGQTPQNLEAFSLSERAALNSVALDIIVTRPLRGIGAGNFALAIPHLRPDMRAQAVHNVPLLLAAEVGIVGGILWLVIALGMVSRFILNARTGDEWLLCAICAFFALSVVSFFDSYPWSLNSGLLLTATVLGLAGRVSREGV